MKGKIEFLVEEDGTLDGAPCVKLEGVAQSNKIVGAYYYDANGNVKDLSIGYERHIRLGDDMLYVVSPTGRHVCVVDQRGNCGVLPIGWNKKITATEDGFIKIEGVAGSCLYYDRLFQESTQPTELGKALYQYDRENIKPEDVIDAYFKEAYKDDRKGVIKNKVMEFILNEEKARAFREIEGMEDVPDEYVKSLESKIAGIEAHLTLKQERLQKREAAKKAISSISFDNKF